MSSEPEKPIEKLLRRWSSERRKQAGENWEIHPVYRRILHQEVARQLGRKGSAEGSWFSRILAVPWLKPAGALAAVVVLLISGWVLFSPPPSKYERSLARNQAPAVPPVPVQVALNDKASEQKEPEESKQFAANAPVAQQVEKAGATSFAAKDSGPGRESLLDEGAARDASKNMVVPKEQQSPLVASSPAPVPRIENLQRYGLARSLGGGVAPAPAAEPTGIQVTATAERGLAEQEAAPTALMLQSAVQGAAAPSNLIQYGRFVATQNEAAPGQDNSVLARRNVSLASSTAGRQSQPASAILTSFQMEQLGPVLRVIDTDNSIYSGTIQGTNPVSAATAAPASTAATDLPKAKAQLQGGQIGNQNFAAFFRVSGTNRSLNQRVVFSGTLSEMTNAYVADAIMQNQGGGGIGGALNLVLTNQQMQKLQVNGTAWVDGKQPLQINAVPAAK